MLNKSFIFVQSFEIFSEISSMISNIILVSGNRAKPLPETSLINFGGVLCFYKLHKPNKVGRMLEQVKALMGREQIFFTRVFSFSFLCFFSLLFTFFGFSFGNI